MTIPPHIQPHKWQVMSQSDRRAAWLAWKLVTFPGPFGWMVVGIALVLWQRA